MGNFLYPRYLNTSTTPFEGTQPTLVDEKDEFPFLPENSKLYTEIDEKSPLVISRSMYFGHKEFVNDFTIANFPDGNNRIITCSDDSTLQIYNINEKKREKVILCKDILICIHFFKEKSHLVALDSRKNVLIWKLFPEIRIEKTMKIPYLGINETDLGESVVDSWRLTQISETEIICGGIYLHCLFCIRWVKNTDYKMRVFHPNDKDARGMIRCIYKSKSLENTILYAGGGGKGDNLNYSSYSMMFGDDEDFCLRFYNYKTSKYKKFPKVHKACITSICSYFDKKNNEITVTGGYDRNLIKWSLDGECLKTIDVGWNVDCLCWDEKRKKIIIGASSIVEKYGVSSYCPETAENEIIFSGDYLQENGRRHCMGWIDERKSKLFFGISGGFFVVNLCRREMIDESKDIDDRKLFLVDGLKMVCNPKEIKVIFVNISLLNLKINDLPRFLLL